MLVKNTYHKRLSFIIRDKTVGIESNQVITVPNEIGIAMLKSPWITDDIAGQCAKCSQGERVTESLKTSEIPKVLDIPEILEIKKEKIKKLEKVEEEKIVEKKIKFKKVEQKK